MKFITMGEVLLRLAPPNNEKIRTCNSFVATYGGGEVNVAAALSNLGVDSSVFTVLPDNSVGKAALRSLRANDVNVEPVIMAPGRMGVYYLEETFGVRSSKVIYDRAGSAFAAYDLLNVDLEKILDGYDWLHLSGITPALSMNCRMLVEQALFVAKQKGITVSFDCNYRSKLWGFQEARDVISPYLPYVDVLFGIEPLNLIDPETGRDIKEGIDTKNPTYEEQDYIFQKMQEMYNFKVIARHVRYVHSGNENSLKGFLYYNGQTYESKTFRFQILDRVGGGDAFASGMIYAIMQNMKPRDMINFGVASSVMKHTIRGDINITDRPEDIIAIMRESYEIKR